MNTRWEGIDPRLYFVTDTALCARAGRSVAATVAAAAAGGAGLVQVRDKHVDDEAFCTLARAVLAAVADATQNTGRRVPVIINDRVAVAQRLRAEGHDVHVHVGQTDMPVAAVRQLLGPAPLIGLSAATAPELAAAAASGVIDLVGIGPAFATSTKTDAGAALGIEGVRAAVAATAIPAFAIGGIDVARTRLLRNTGIVGVCVASALCLAADPAATARAFLAAFGAPHV